MLRGSLAIIARSVFILHVVDMASRIRKVSTNMLNSRQEAVPSLGVVSRTEMIPILGVVSRAEIVPCLWNVLGQRQSPAKGLSRGQR
jgi:hypothetical protein